MVDSTPRRQLLLYRSSPPYSHTPMRFLGHGCRCYFWGNLLPFYLITLTTTTYHHDDDEDDNDYYYYSYCPTTTPTTPTATPATTSTTTAATATMTTTVSTAMITTRSVLLISEQETYYRNLNNYVYYKGAPKPYSNY